MIKIQRLLKLVPDILNKNTLININWFINTTLQIFWDEINQGCITQFQWKYNSGGLVFVLMIQVEIKLHIFDQYDFHWKTPILTPNFLKPRFLWSFNMYVGFPWVEVMVTLYVFKKYYVRWKYDPNLIGSKAT